MTIFLSNIKLGGGSSVSRGSAWEGEGFTFKLLYGRKHGRCSDGTAEVPSSKLFRGRACSHHCSLCQRMRATWRWRRPTSCRLCVCVQRRLRQQEDVLQSSWTWTVPPPQLRQTCSPDSDTTTSGRSAVILSLAKIQFVQTGKSYWRLSNWNLQEVLKKKKIQTGFRLKPYFLKTWSFKLSWMKCAKRFIYFCWVIIYFSIIETQIKVFTFFSKNE